MREERAECAALQGRVLAEETMRSRTMLGWIVVAIVLGGLALGGCRKSEEQKAKETAQAFFSAAETDNKPALKNTLTEQARRNVKIEPHDKNMPGFDGDYTLENASVHDDTAEVNFVMKNKDGDSAPGHFTMRRENGEWRIYAMTLKALPNGGEITMNFENPTAVFADLFRELPSLMAEGMKAMGEGFKAMGEGFKSAGEQIKREAAHAQQTP